MILLTLLTQNTDSPSEPVRVICLDEVNKFLHDHRGLTLSVLNVQHESVLGQDVGVVVDILHGHDGYGS